MKKRTKLGIKIFAVMLICIISIGGFVGNYFYNLALNPNTPKDMIFASEDDSSDLEVKSDVDWLFYKHSQRIHEKSLQVKHLEVHIYL